MQTKLSCQEIFSIFLRKIENIRLINTNRVNNLLKYHGIKQIMVVYLISK